MHLSLNFLRREKENSVSGMASLVHCMEQHSILTMKAEMEGEGIQECTLKLKRSAKSRLNTDP